MDKIQRSAYGLTDETRKVINGSAKAIADEIGWSDKTVYKITYDEMPDPFAYFKAFYAGCVRAGVDVSHYDVTLSEIKARYTAGKKGSEIECLADKIATNADTTHEMVSALRDGEIAEAELMKIRTAIQKERDALDVLDITLGFTDVREYGRLAVVARRGGK